jgi:hypothetical protein
MISPCNLNKGLVFTVLFAVAAMLAGCVTSEKVPLNAVATPAKAGAYQVQYLVNGKWTKFATGSLTLANRTYTWAEDREALSLLSPRFDRMRFRLVDIGDNYFIVVVASTDLGNPTWVGNYMYGVARRVGGALLYDLPSCLDLLVSQGFTELQIEKIKAHECLYASKATLTGALTRYAKRTAMWKRLAPSGH